jgi:hypothetical protein
MEHDKGFQLRLTIEAHILVFTIAASNKLGTAYYEKPSRSLPILSTLKNDWANDALKQKRGEPQNQTESLRSHGYLTI